jgi:E3 ubiquitin-protein ligase RHF
MQRLYAAASRARLVQRQKRQGSPGAGPSEMFVFNSSLQPTLTISPGDSSSPIYGLPSIGRNHPEVARNISRIETDVPYRPRYWLSMTFLSIIKQSNWQTGNSYLDRSSFLECLF